MIQRLPIAGTIGATYREWWRVCSTLRPLLFSAFIVFLAIAAITDFIPRRYWEQSALGEILSLAQQAIQSVLLAPIIIAIHRCVILDKPSRAYSFPADDPRFWLFVGWLFALEVLVGLPLDMLSLMQSLQVPVAASTTVFAVLLIVAIALALRLSILLPGIAVDAEPVKPAQALADTKGYVMRMLAVIIAATIPWFVASVLVIRLIGPRIDAVGSFPAMMGLVVNAVTETALLSVITVILSLVFVALSGKGRRSLAERA